MKGAGFDPAFIPGLTSPASDETEDTRPEEEAEDAVELEEEFEAEPEEEREAETEEAEETAAAEASEEQAPEEEAPDGPVFEASDRRAKIVADHKGVRLSLDEQECEFRWDEIGAIETETARFGKRYTITVHTPDRRWYPIEIEATARSRFTEWDEQLDAVLDAYFEDGQSPEEGRSSEDEPSEDSES